MTLRNAFQDVSQDATLIDTTRGVRHGYSRPARSPSNADHVYVDNTTTNYTYRTYLWDAGSYSGWWSVNTVMTVDFRQQLSESTRTTSVLNRQRWSYA